MKGNAILKIHSAEKHWHNTVGEYLLKYAGIFLALSIVFIGLSYGYNRELITPDKDFVHMINSDSDRSGKTLIFVMLNSDEAYNLEAKVLKEAIVSYHGVNIISLQGNYDQLELKEENQIVFVMGSQEIDDVTGVRNLMEMVAERDVPLFWLGSGFEQVAHIFDLSLSGDEGSLLTPPMSSMTYNGTEIDASGLRITRGNLADFSELGEVLASVTLHGTFNRPVLIRHGDIIYSAFNPFPRDSAPFALSVIMDSLSLLVGEHKPNPRVIFRLEDINGITYNEYDSSFRKTVDYLMDQEVYVHLGIIPTMVDAEGKLVAQIDAALPVLEFVRQNPGRVGIVQHGYKHFRKAPRNEGMGSGDAFEFFINDDETMGAKEAGEFAEKVIKQGRAVMVENGLVPYIFEAPHYQMSPAQQQAADQIFYLMQHEPLFYGGPSGFLLPWFTQRNTTVYAPGFSGFVALLNPDSVNNVLYSLEQAASILPDPVVVVFFHPFMKEVQGRQGDLEKLIQGIKGLNYQFVNMMDEVEPLTALP